MPTELGEEEVNWQRADPAVVGTCRDPRAPTVVSGVGGSRKGCARRQGPRVMVQEGQGSWCVCWGCYGALPGESREEAHSVLEGQGCCPFPHCQDPRAGLLSGALLGSSCRAQEVAFTIGPSPAPEAWLPGSLLTLPTTRRGRHMPAPALLGS